MKNPNKALRVALRWSHILAGALVAAVVYSPLRENAAFVLAAQVALLPVLILTGLWMWQQARVRRLLGRSSRGRSR